ncbi:MAG: 2-oxo acid dehydrogenase subunit E2 [Chloroflexi bacterium]|nr:2-oxo acid dehydrogenase subunit E2 [Chloroflexota bacterium]
MATQLVMPQMGYDMTQGVLVRWLKEEGAQVKRGEPVAEIETDKAVVEMEATAAGILRKLLANPGASIPVGQAIAIVGAADEDISALVPAATDGQPGATAPAATVAPPSPIALPTPAAPAEGPAEEVRVTPVARRLAQEKGVDLRRVKGTGPGGRITREDVEAAAAQRQPAAVAVPAPTPAAAATPMPTAPARPPAPAPAVAAGRVELSRMRQAIARATSQSKQGVPHFYVTIAADMTAALALRAQVNESQQQVKVTINDLVLRAAVLALKKFPNLNASYRDTYVEAHPYIHLGIAIGREQGLVVPAIVNAHEKTLIELALASKDLAERVQSGRLRQDEYNGTFSTSNLGMFGVEEFSAIILPPQAAVLAIAAVRPEAVVVDGQVAVRQMMRLTISVDHRVSDGVEGARFMQEIKGLLEKPVSLLV